MSPMANQSSRYRRLRLPLVVLGCGNSRPQASPEELVALDQAVAQQQSDLRTAILEDILASLQQDILEGREPRLTS